MIRPGTIGPRSLIRTTTARRLRRFVTLTIVPKGREGCAAVRSYMLKGSPLAVGLPSKSSPYHEAVPIWYARPLGLTPGIANEILSATAALPADPDLVGS